jgi:hypothetical protein
MITSIMISNSSTRSIVRMCLFNVPGAKGNVEKVVNFAKKNFGMQIPVNGGFGLPI